MMTREEIKADRRIIATVAREITSTDVAAEDASTDTPLPSADADFIAAARERWPLALDDVERLSKALAKAHGLVADVCAGIPVTPKDARAMFDMIEAALPPTSRR